jgi:ABC-type branched-subunit amino acid transport system substrate-binding protein
LNSSQFGAPRPVNTGATVRFRRWWPPRQFQDPWYYQHRGFAAVAVAVLLVLGGVFVLPQAISRWSCGEAFPWAGVWSDGGECVGVTDGSYSFGPVGTVSTAPVFSQLATLNRQDQCPGPQKPVTVTIGALVTLNSLNAGLRGLHELEGFAAGLREANLPSSDMSMHCAYRLRLLVAQMGSNEQAATADAQALVANGVVAVVGMGLSNQQSADAAAILNADHIAMVSDDITGEGFDQDGSKEDHPDFSGCQSASTVPGAAPYWQHAWPYFFRVAYRTTTQVNEVLDYLRTLPQPNSPQDFLVQPTDPGDAYTCSTVPAIESGLAKRGMPGRPQILDFATAQAQPTEDSVAYAICNVAKPVTVFYAARAVYLSSLLDDILWDKVNRGCSPTSITIVSQSDAAQLRIPSVYYEPSRDGVLTSNWFRKGWLRIYYTPLADPNLIGHAGNPKAPGYTALTGAFTKLGFNQNDLVDGWAIMAYDSVTTVATALEQISPVGSSAAPPPVTGALIQSQILNELGATSRPGAPGADGTITFDNNGNRTGNGPGVVMLCPDANPSTTPPQTVPVTPGQVGICPPDK